MSKAPQSSQKFDWDDTGLASARVWTEGPDPRKDREPTDRAGRALFRARRDVLAADLSIRDRQQELKDARRR